MKFYIAWMVFLIVIQVIGWTFYDQIEAILY